MPNFHATDPLSDAPFEQVLNATKPPSPDKNIREILASSKKLHSLNCTKPFLQKPIRKEIPLTGWLTEREVASAIGCSLSLLRQNRHFQRGIPYIKMGRSVRYEAATVKKFMEDQTIMTK